MLNRLMKLNAVYILSGLFSRSTSWRGSHTKQADLKQHTDYKSLSTFPPSFSPLPCPSLSLEATHSGLFFVSLSLVSQGYAFVLLSCLVQECYLCGGLICFITSCTSPRPSLHCFLTKVNSSPFSQEFAPYLCSRDAFYSTTPWGKACRSEERL